MFSVGWFIFFTMFLTSFWGILNVDPNGCDVGRDRILRSTPIADRVVGFPPVEPAPRRSCQSGQRRPTPATLHGSSQAPGLPPQRQQPATEYTAPAGGWRAPDTGDLVGPGSVVEGTTKLLQRDE